ncbi:MAG: hypothetical protein R3C05_30930 [Pirellulaceae bacterium]
MVIIWGQKPYFKRYKVSSYGFCQHCNRFVKRQSFHARTFFHLYYIPFIPTGAKMRHHQYCPKCQQCLLIPLDEFAQSTEELKTRAAECVMAIMDGETTVRFDGMDEAEGIECVAALAELIDWLHDAGERTFIVELINRLGQAQQSLPHTAMQAELDRIQGSRREAIERLQGLMNSHADHGFPPRRVAPLLTLEKRHADAAEAWNRALAMESDTHARIGLLLMRIEALNAAKQWSEAVKAYDELFAIEDSLRNDRAIYKSYTKSRKKAGIG